MGLPSGLGPREHITREPRAFFKLQASPPSPLSPPCSMLSAMLSPRPRVGDLEQRAAARAAVPVFDLVRLSSSSSASSRDLVEHVVVFQYKGIKVEVMVEVLAIMAAAEH